MCLRLRAPRAPGSLLTPRSGVPAPHTQPARVPDAAHACRMLAVLRFCAVRASQRRSIHQIAAFCMRFSDRPGAPMRPPTPSPPPPLAGPDHHWWRAGRLCCRHQSRPARPQDRVRGGPRVTGGHLPERGVHSIQGEAQLRGNSHSICTPRCHVQHDRGSHQPTCPLDMHTRACTGLHGGRRSGCTMGGTSFGGRPASAAACRTTRAWLQALLNASHKYHEAAKELHNFGVMASGVTFDWSKMQARGCSGRAGAAVLVRAAPTAGQRAPLQRQQLASVLPCSLLAAPGAQVFVGATSAQRHGRLQRQPSCRVPPALGPDWLEAPPQPDPRLSGWRTGANTGAGAHRRRCCCCSLQRTPRSRASPRELRGCSRRTR